MKWARRGTLLSCLPIRARLAAFSGFETWLLATEAKESLSASLDGRSKEARDRGECSKPGSVTVAGSPNGRCCWAFAASERIVDRVVLRGGSRQPRRLQRRRRLAPDRGPPGWPVNLERAMRRPRRGQHPARACHRRTLRPQKLSPARGFCEWSRVTRLPLPTYQA